MSNPIPPAPSPDASQPYVDPETQRIYNFLGANSPDWQIPERQAAMKEYVNRVIAEESVYALTDRRLLEMSGAARQAFGGSVQDQARALLIADGRSPDLAKLPDGYRQRIAAMGLGDADIADLATKWYPHLSRKEAVAKWTQTAVDTMKDDAGPAPILGWDGTTVRGRVYGNGG